MIKTFKNIIQNKLGNIITDAKAQSIIDNIFIHENADPEKVIAAWSNMIDLPDWVKSEVTINETFFFRHPDQFESIISLLKGKNDVKLLSVGTSSGEEAYSLAMICEELNLSSYKIEGLDLDPHIISKARAGKYPPHQIDRTPLSHRPLLMKYGELKNTWEGMWYIVSPQIHKHVEFKEANVLNYNSTNKYDVIFIRNILIYFTDEDKVKIMRRLQACLKPGGRIVIGPAEVLPENIKEAA